MPNPLNQMRGGMPNMSRNAMPNATSNAMPNAGGGAPRSLLNPQDAAMSAMSGQINQNMTVGEFLQQSLGVSPNDPVSKLIQAAKGQMQSKTIPGKLSMMQQQPQRQQSQAPAGIEELMNNMRG